MEEAIEKNFFGTLAGPERSRESTSTGGKSLADGTNKRPLPWGPVVVLLLLTMLLLAVFLAGILQTIVNPATRPPPTNFYMGADIVGLAVTLSLFAMLAWSYICVSLTDPGRVPKEWPWDPKQVDPRPDFTDPNESSSLTKPLKSRLRGLERKLDGRTRFCKKCNMYKPDRAHHCKKLGRCVLEMDHWCPWVRNTIGYRNRKYFFLSVTYGWTTLFSYCVVLGPYLPSSAQLRDTLDFFVIFCWVLALIECLLLMTLWSFHVFLTIHSFTTIEFREKHLAKGNKTARTGEKVSELYKESLYDVGVWESFKHLLGPNPLLWPFPTRLGQPNGEDAGIYFAVREDHPLVRLATKNSENGSKIFEKAESQTKEMSLA